MKSKKKILYIVTIAVLAVILCVSAFLVIRYLWQGKRQKDAYDDLSQIVADAQTETTQAPTQPPETTVPETTEETEATEPTMLAEYQAIYELNSDTVGWIKIEGTEVDYPVMQTPDETDYYLYRNFDKSSSDWGAIYAREVCDVNEPSDNITIYGHNMADGSMFGSLKTYINQSAWENNSLIFFDTLYEYHTYQIFAVFATSANLGEGFSYHQFVDAEDEEEFNEFVATCKSLAYYDTGITPVYGDKLICLSTCEYTHDNGRLVIAAVRIT